MDLSEARSLAQRAVIKGETRKTTLGRVTSAILAAYRAGANIKGAKDVVESNSDERGKPKSAG